MKRQLKIPAKVLASAKTAAAATPRKPVPPAHQPRQLHPERSRGGLAREKVIAALKKLHPMD